MPCDANLAMPHLPLSDAQPRLVFCRLTILLGEHHQPVEVSTISRLPVDSKLYWIAAMSLRRQDASDEEEDSKSEEEFFSDSEGSIAGREGAIPLAQMCYFTVCGLVIDIASDKLNRFFLIMVSDTAQSADHQGSGVSTLLST